MHNSEALQRVQTYYKTERGSIEYLMGVSCIVSMAFPVVFSSWNFRSRAWIMARSAARERTRYAKHISPIETSTRRKTHRARSSAPPSERGSAA